MNIRTSFDDLSKGYAVEYGRYNGFYRRADVRKVFYDLFKGKCAATGDQISLHDAEVGHIVPRSRPEVFEALYPGLDVDNAINLHLISKDVNRRASDGIVPSPHAIHNAVSFSAKRVDQKLAKILARQSDGDYSWLKQECEKAPDNEYYTGLAKTIDAFETANEVLSNRQGRFAFAYAGTKGIAETEKLRFKSQYYQGKDMETSLVSKGEVEHGFLLSDDVPMAVRRKMSEEQFSGTVFLAKEVRGFVNFLKKDLDMAERLQRQSVAAQSLGIGAPT